MDNYQIADHFTLLSKLMDIHGDNPFKSKSYSAAAFNIEKLPVQLTAMSEKERASAKGIGDSTAKKIKELLETGRLGILDEVMAKTPPGIIEMLNIKGLGPKKIATIWKDLEVESIGELLYACNENRLILYKGFGEKTQANVKDAITFFLGNKGFFLYAQVARALPAILEHLQQWFAPNEIRITGAYRRCVPVIEVLELLVPDNFTTTKEKLSSSPLLIPEKETEHELYYKVKDAGLTICIHTGNNNDLFLFETTGNNEFLTAFREKFPKLSNPGTSTGNDEIIFTQAGIPYIPPVLRESAAILNDKTPPPVLIEASDIKGIIHNHSNWSDGMNTVEEMAKACIALGMEYLVISDHSKSAFYANGLSEERIKEQHKYIDELNEKLAPFKIFKSIECDILNDGQLDYSDKILSSFDLVIASVHSNLKMSEEKAMMRLLTAIKNPYTTILGHMTGRLLLSREGYPVNHETIIDACAEHAVAIELNAHPSRLDIDWQHIGYALSKHVPISIDPDAHHTDGFYDIHYGVLAAQKAGVQKHQNLSCYSLKEFEDYLEVVKKKKMQ
jgi:DNA polymerase (family X)